MQMMITLIEESAGGEERVCWIQKLCWCDAGLCCAGVALESGKCGKESNFDADLCYALVMEGLG